MRVDFETLVDSVLLRAGEIPEMCSSGGEGEGPESVFRRIIRMRLPSAAAEVLNGMPADEVSGWKPLGGDGLVQEEDDHGILPLPGDFLRLHSLRLEGWERPVVKVLPHDHWLRALQWRRWHGLRGNAIRPLAFFTQLASGKGLELFPGGGGVVEGYYLPFPAVDSDGFMELPREALERVAEVTLSPFSA